MRQPDFRLQEASKREKGHEDPRVQALADLLHEGACEDQDVAYAYDIRADAYHRSVMDAFLLSGTDPTVVEDLLKIPSHVIDTYHHLFMDTSVFRNRLERISYAAEYEGSEQERETVRVSVMVGPEVLLWMYGGSPELEPRDIVRRTMSDAFFRGLAHKGNSVTSSTAKESLKWWHTSIRNAELLEKIEPSTAKQAHEELRIAIAGEDNTYSAEDSPVPLDEILH